MYETLLQFVPKENILRDVMLCNYTTFGVGGKVSYFIEIENLKQIKALVSYFNVTKYPYVIIGHGSNLLVGDEGYQGVVLHIGHKMSELSVQGNQITAQAGASLAKLAQTAREHSLTGAEFAFGIPGTVGGGCVMNAGAYGGEMSQIVRTVTVVNGKGEILVLDNPTMEFGYRNSVVKQYPYIIVEVSFEFELGDKEQIVKTMNEFTKSRKEKQPLEYKSAGSTFKRPEGNFAGKLIMEAGLMGQTIGGAQVSKKHAGFIINLGNARAKDIQQLIELVIEKVYDDSGIRLEREVIYIGDF